MPYLPVWVLIMAVGGLGQYLEVFAYKFLKRLIEMLSASSADVMPVILGFAWRFALGIALSSIAVIAATWLRTRMYKRVGAETLRASLELVKGGADSGHLASAVADSGWDLMSIFRADTDRGLMFFFRIGVIASAIGSMDRLLGWLSVVFATIVIIWFAGETVWYTRNDYKIDERFRDLKGHLTDTLEGVEDIHLLGRVEPEARSASDGIRDVMDAYGWLLIVDYLIASFPQDLLYVGFLLAVVLRGLNLGVATLATLLVYASMLKGTLETIWGIFATLEELFSSGRKLHRLLSGRV